MSNQGKREKIIQEYFDLLDKAKNADSEVEKKHYADLSHEKHQEILMYDMGRDKNIGRFNEF